MLSCSYIRTWKEEHGDQPSMNESMEVTTDYVSVGPSAVAMPATSTPEPKPSTSERMETDGTEEEKKKPTPPKNKGKKKAKNHKF